MQYKSLPHGKSPTWNFIYKNSAKSYISFSVCFNATSPRFATIEVFTSGRGELLADVWYDNNKAIKHMFRLGYVSERT